MPHSENDILRLIKSAAPERQEELERLWESHRPNFRYLDDSPGFTLEVRFDHVVTTQRTLDQLWFASSVCFHSARVFYSHLVTTKTGEVPLNSQALADDVDYAKEVEALTNLWQQFRELGRAALPGDFCWPNDIVPLPQSERPLDNREAQAIFDTVGLALSFWFLHEVRHLQFDIEETRPIDPAEEEVICDKYAWEFMLRDIAAYHELRNEPIDQVQSKRRLGVAVGLATVLAVTAGVERTNGTHPASSERLLMFIDTNADNPDADCWALLASMLLSMLPNDVRNRPLTPFRDYRALAREIIQRF